VPLESSRGTPNCIDPNPGLLDETAKVAPLIQTTPSDPSLQRHFSAFALTSHLHSPVLRLVSLHPSLSISVSFLRVPEIHDGFVWKCFFSRTTTVRDVVESILDTLGLTRSLPVPGGGSVHYVLEEVWAEGDTESEFHAPPHSISSDVFLIIPEAATLPQDAIFYDLLTSSGPPTNIFLKREAFLPVLRPGRVVPSLTTTLDIFHVT
jgi:hypothetical protein